MFLLGRSPAVQRWVFLRCFFGGGVVGLFDAGALQQHLLNRLKVEQPLTTGFQ